MFESGLSDHHKLISTTMKSGSFKGPPKKNNKKIYRCYKNNTSMTKKLRKEIMKRSTLKHNFKKNRNHENWCKYKTQRNYCVNLLRKSKKQYFRDINVRDVSDSKSSWKSLTPYFSNKGSNSKLFKNSFDTDINQITSVFKSHVSIKKIHECFPSIEANDFNFRQVSLKEVK